MFPRAGQTTNTFLVDQGTVRMKQHKKHRRSRKSLIGPIHDRSMSSLPEVKQATP